MRWRWAIPVILAALLWNGWRHLPLRAAAAEPGPAAVFSVQIGGAASGSSHSAGAAKARQALNQEGAAQAGQPKRAAPREHGKARRHRPAAAEKIVPPSKGPAPVCKIASPASVVSPETVRKAIRDGIQREATEADVARMAVHEGESEYGAHETLKDLEEEMHRAADDLDFETAAKLRDRIVLLQEKAGLKPLAEWKPRKVQRGKKWRRRGV